MIDEAVVCTTDQHLLGEGARWDAGRNELLRVDTLAGRTSRLVALGMAKFAPCHDPSH